METLPVLFFTIIFIKEFRFFCLNYDKNQTISTFNVLTIFMAVVGANISIFTCIDCYGWRIY